MYVFNFPREIFSFKNIQEFIDLYHKKYFNYTFFLHEYKY